MVNRITLMASAIAALVVSASAFLAQPGQAQTTAQAKETENECLRAPKGVAPKGSHWFYRLDRANGNRRCWYLGSESQKVRRAAPERKAAAAPAPKAENEAPPLPRARTASRSVMPTVETNAVEAAPAAPAATTTNTATFTSNTTNTTTNAPAGSNDSSPATAPRLSAAWPVAASNTPSAAGPSDREGATAASTGNAEEATTTTAQEMAPSVSPAPVSADAAAAENSSAPTTPGVGHVLLFLAALGAFIIIAIRALVKLLSRASERAEPRFAVQRAAPVIRPRAPERRSIDHITEPATQEGRPLRPLDIATRWDTAPTRWDNTPRLPRTPNVPLYDDTHNDDARRVEEEARRLREAALYAQEGPALRRRRRVA